MCTIKSINPLALLALLALLVALVVLSLAVAFVGLHLANPSDGARLPHGDQSAWKADGPF